MSTLSGDTTGTTTPCAIVKANARVRNHVDDRTTPGDIASMSGLTARSDSTVTSWISFQADMKRCNIGPLSDSQYIKMYFSPIKYSPSKTSPWQPFTPIDADIEGLEFFVPNGDPHVIVLPFSAPYEKANARDGLGAGGASKRYASFLGQAVSLLGVGGYGQSLEILYQVACHLFSIEVVYLLHQRRNNFTGNDEKMLEYAESFIVPVEEADQTGAAAMESGT